MKFSTTTALLACAASQAHAFSDSSPFILFSTAKYVPPTPPSLARPTLNQKPELTNLSLPRLPSPASEQQLQTSAQVLTTAKALLASCPTRRYILVSQPNMHAADVRASSFSGCGGSGMPNLCRAVHDAPKDGGGGGGGVWAVAEVIGQVSGKPIGEYVREACAHKGVEASVERVELRHLPAVSEHEADKGRRGALGDNGTFLFSSFVSSAVALESGLCRGC